MAYISYNKLWESEFDKIVSKNDKVQDFNPNQSKPKVNETYEKDEKLATKFEAVNGEDVINKAYLKEELSKTAGHLSLLEKDFNEYKILTNKQFMEEILIQRTVKTTIEILSDEGLFDGFPNAEAVPNDFLFVVRPRLDLREVNDDVIQ